MSSRSLEDVLKTNKCLLGYVQWFLVGKYFELVDRVHHKMKLEAAFKALNENLKTSLNLHPKSLKMSVKEFISVRLQTSCEQLY